jgi:serine/threonine protein kinase
MAREESFIGDSGAEWRYWTDQPLGTPGGFGGVYAGAASDGTAVAVKIVAKQRPGGALDNRLLRREIEIGKRVAQVDADLLLPVIDAKETDNALLLVMARADGALADVALPVAETVVVATMTDIAYGLQELHNIGIIHRDLKPANVLRHNDRWKLADFGIARDEEIGTQNPTFLGWGSPPYMSPELWNRQSPTVKTDLYALGCVGFELLAGEPPYMGEVATIRTGHLTHAVPQVPSGNTTLRNLITRLLTKEPGGRPQDARAVLERLQRVVLAFSPVQEDIARRLEGHAAEMSRESADRAAMEAGELIKRQQVSQARADLREIVDDALEDLQDVEPGVTLQDSTDSTSRRFGTYPGRVPSSIILYVDDVRLRIDLWEQGIFEYPPAADDTIALACAVTISNRWYGNELNAANLVYEQLGDRFGWQIYRFRATTARPDRYPYGPHGRTHGLEYQDFYGQWGRRFMIHPVRHVWQMAVERLSTDTLLGLFREAIDLRPPDPRTGIWRRS